jgi:hypothetical protein
MAPARQWCADLSSRETARRPRTMAPVVENRAREAALHAHDAQPAGASRPVRLAALLRQRPPTHRRRLAFFLHGPVRDSAAVGRARHIGSGDGVQIISRRFRCSAPQRRAQRAGRSRRECARCARASIRAPIDLASSRPHLTRNQNDSSTDICGCRPNHPKRKA